MIFLAERDETRLIQDIHFNVKIKRVYPLSGRRVTFKSKGAERERRGARNDVDKSRKMISLEHDGVNRGGKVGFCGARGTAWP